MSLLMEALRKAEQAKRQMQQDEQARGSDAAQEPASASAFTLEERRPGVTSDVSAEAAPEVTPQYIRENFIAGQDTGSDATQNTTLADADVLHARQAQQRQQRAAAASVFAAKRKPAPSRRTLTILVSLLLLMLPLGGGILWYLQAANTSSIGLNPALANYDLSSRRVDDAASPALAATETEVEAAPLSQPPAQITDTNTAAAPQPAPATPVPTVPAPTVPVPSTPGAAAPALALPANTQTPVLEVSRSRGTPQVNPDLVNAYARLQQGDLVGAGMLYRQVLAALPNNRDALLGLASVHMREEQAVSARELYARLLQLNPRDPLAHTGLLQTMQAGSAIEHENTLKQLQTQYPNVAQLTLALGNHYAAQGRWSEAQAAYYNALLTARRNANGPVHPDYAFNLAVSLEQLNQPKVALDYYRQALALAAEVTPGFDLQLLNSRLDTLDELLLEQAP